MKLRPENVPHSLLHLLPLAEKWGIGDDFEREEAINNASKEELIFLIHSIDDISDEDLFGWLAGKESINPNPSPEYIAITCLTMAIDSAKVKLKRLK
jgi:hypothetical protein